MNNKEILEMFVKVIDGKKAENIRIFDVKNTSTVTDYVIICNGSSDRQVKSIADSAITTAEDYNLYVSIEGQREGKWVLVDLGFIIIHIFTKVEREYYNLERLYHEAKIVEL